MNTKTSLVRPSNTVAKHNILIEKSYKLNLVELKLLSGIISLVNSLTKEKGGDVEFRTYRIKISDIHKLLGFKSKGSLSDIKNAFQGLMSKGYRIEATDDNNLTKGEIFTWIEKTTYAYRDGDGYFDVKLKEHLQEYLLGLEGTFTQYKLQNILNLENPYSLRMYEILKGSSVKGNKKITLEKLRYILELQKKYPLFANFKVKVLDVFVNEINNKTDISVSYLLLKEGRKVVGVDFIIKNNIKQTNEEGQVTEDAINVSIENQLLSIGIQDTVLNDLLIKYGREKLGNNYDLLIKEITQKGTDIKNKAGWFIKSLENNYKEKNQKNTNIITDLYKAQKNEQDLQNKKDELKREKRKIAKEEFKKWIDSLSDGKRNKLLEKYKTGKPLRDKELLILGRIREDYLLGNIK